MCISIALVRSYSQPSYLSKFTNTPAPSKTQYSCYTNSKVNINALPPWASQQHKNPPNSRQVKMQRVAIDISFFKPSENAVENNSWYADCAVITEGKIYVRR